MLLRCQRPRHRPDDDDGDLQVMAARVGAEANGTQTRCVQLARLRPVRIYRMMNNPMLVPLKIALCQTMATATQATK